MNTLRGVTAVDYQITVRPDFAAGARGDGWRSAGMPGGAHSARAYAGREARSQMARRCCWSARRHAVDNLEVESGR